MGLVRLVRQSLPPGWQPPARYMYERVMGLLERELPLAKSATRRGDRVIDVGANVGIYTYAFASAGARVEAFEPQSGCADILDAFARGRRGITVHRAALGASAGQATLHVPAAGDRSLSGNASLRAGDTGGTGGTTEAVGVRALDSYAFDDAALVKIDVEGFELEVIAGATRTLAASKPLLLVEIEQRHHAEPISRVFARLESLGYAGFFLDAGRRLVPVNRFDVESCQSAPLRDSKAGPYINNFLFEPAGGERRWPR